VLDKGDFHAREAERMLGFVCCNRRRSKLVLSSRAVEAADVKSAVALSREYRGLGGSSKGSRVPSIIVQR
jgi:hypothetical protein